MPGPRDATRRPRRKMTARSYSLRILMPLMTNPTAKTNTVAAGPNIAASLQSPLALRRRRPLGGARGLRSRHRYASHLDAQTAHLGDLRLLTYLDRLVGDR